MSESLNPSERQLLLELARSALETSVRGQALPALELNKLPKRLQAPGATFVTLTISGELRGCIGALEARHPLAQDVREHAVAAALQDYRFPPVAPEELDQIEIEISRLTPLQALEYRDSQDLLSKLRPQQDGVMVREGFRRATFLPQVWEKLGDPAEFMERLCQKMGVEPNYWRYHKLEVYTYQVEEFHEEPG